MKCVNSGDRDIDCIGIDTWGVDYGLLDKNGKLLGNPYHYRDTRTEGMYDEAFKRVPKEEIFQRLELPLIGLIPYSSFWLRSFPEM